MELVLDINSTDPHPRKDIRDSLVTATSSVLYEDESSILSVEVRQRQQLK